MNNIFSTVKFTLLFTVAILAGCGGSEEAAVESSPAPTATNVALVEPAVSPQEAVEKARELELAAAEAVERFTPPFARRTDLFQRPDATKAAGIVRKRREERGGDVQLKGFVNVDQPRAMLQIDGQLWIAGVGDKKNEIEVAEVSPPNVSLQRAGTPMRLSLHEGT